MKGEGVVPAAKIAKPEEMTHLNAHRVVAKDHPRIRFRGQLDQLQAQIVLVQLELEREADHRELIDELEDILSLLRRVMRSEVLDEPLEDERILGLTLEELRAQSHDPKAAFGVDPMAPPSRRFGRAWALMNLLRAESRVAEETAVAAFKTGPSKAQQQLLRIMNRLSSVFHILMCRLQADVEHGG